jgi:hypothetical protein
MNKLVFIASTVLSVSLFAQEKFEKGYIIDAQGVKKDGLIKNLDWEFNPETFQYKSDEKSSTQILGIGDVREFGIGNSKKYISSFVKIDSSSDVLSKTSSRLTPFWHSRRVFMKVLVDGNMSLYSYRTKGYHRFYYKLKSDSITPLIYKRYSVGSSQFAYNKQYIMQLEKLMDCGDLSRTVSVNYMSKPLTDLVSRYNECTNSSTVSYQLERKIALSGKFTIGINSSSYKAYVAAGLFKGADFNQTITPRFGMEIEMLLPNWENRWSIIFDPNYRIYKSEVTSGGDKFSVDYKSIEIPMGVRTHFFLRRSGQIFADVYFIVDQHLGNTPVKIDNSIFNEKSNPNYALSIGYSSGKLAIALRAHSGRSIASEYRLLDNSFKNVSLIASYGLFKTASD